MGTIRILSPAGESRARALSAPPLPDLRGKRVGVIDNRKTNFDRLVADLAALLRERHGVAEVVHRQKANASVPAPPEMLAELVGTCDVVLTGSGD